MELGHILRKAWYKVFSIKYWLNHISDFSFYMAFPHVAKRQVIKIFKKFKLGPEYYYYIKFESQLN